MLAPGIALALVLLRGEVEGGGMRTHAIPITGDRFLTVSVTGKVDAGPACLIAGAASANIQVRASIRKPVKYSLQVRDRELQAGDRERANGCTFVWEAESLTGRERLSKLEAAGRQFEAASDPERLSETLTSIGVVQWDLGLVSDSVASHERAMRIFPRAAGAHRLAAAYLLTNRAEAGKEMLRTAERLARETGDESGEADALSDLALQSSREGQYSEATRLSDRAIELKLQVGDRVGEANAQNLRGIIQQNAGFLEDAVDRYSRALRLREELEDEPGQAQCLNNLATVYAQLGERLKAIEILERVLEIRKRTAGPQAVANTQHNLGVSYVQGGDFDRGMEMFDSALLVWRATGHRPGEAATLAEQARAYSQLGIPDRAVRAYQQAATLNRLMKNQRGESNVLAGLGAAYSMGGQVKAAAEAYAKAYELAKLGHFPQEEFRALQGMGSLAYQSGDYRSAIAKLSDALRFNANLYPVDALWGKVALGRALLKSPERERAQPVFSEVVEQAIAWENRPLEFSARAGLAQAAAEAGDYQLAREEAERAIHLLEDLRSNVSSLDVRALFLSQRYEVFQVAAHALMKLGRTEDAFVTSDRGRARTLLEELQSDRDETLDERRARVALNAKAARLTTLLSQSKDATSLRREVARLSDEYAAARLRAARQRPELARTAEPATLNAIRKHLASGEALIEYSLGSKLSYCWLVTHSGLQGFLLPPRAELESLAGNLRAAVSDPGSPEQATLAVEKLKKALGVHLSSRTKRLYLVADGALQTIPLAALRIFGDVVTASLPSASLLARLERPRKAVQTAAVFSDPVYESSDERVIPPVPSDGDGLRRLRFSAMEAEAIGGVAKARVDAGFGATREAVLKVAGSTDVLHIAAHGLWNSEDPGLSAIALSLVDRKGRTVDGFLRANDVRQMQLRSSLVVLSACDTALGRSLNGEGLMGFTRAFLAARASGVVASLWKVDDAATAEWMRVFYEALVIRKLHTAEAVRVAQAEIKSRPKWAHPFYWAGFTYFGL